MILPQLSTMDTVYVDSPVKTRNPFFFGPKCQHLNTTKFTWIDHRAGPGSFADTFEGQVCVACSTITKMVGINGTRTPKEFMKETHPEGYDER